MMTNPSVFNAKPTMAWAAVATQASPRPWIHNGAIYSRRPEACRRIGEAWMYAKDRTWRDGWRRAYRAGWRVVKVTVSIAPNQGARVT